MLKTRSATIEDSELLLRWRNDPLTVANSLSTRAVTQVEHDKWLPEKLASKESLLLIIEKGGTPCGQVRLDQINNEYLISYLVAPEFRKQGLAKKILIAGIEACQQSFGPGVMLKALVREDNLASVKSFVDLGFSAAGIQVDNQVRYLVFTKSA